MSAYTNRYTAKVMARARELHEAEWSSPKISAILEREMGVKPSPTMIRAWCSTEKAEAKRQAERERMRRTYRARNPRRTNARLSEDWKAERMRELLLRGLSCRAIGQVAAVWWGEELSEYQVYKALGIKRGDLGRKASRRAA